MSRGDQTSARFKAPATPPFGGLLAHMNPGSIGPIYAQDCDNVLVHNSRLKKRFGLDKVQSDFGEIADARIEGVWAGRKTGDDGNTDEMIVVKTTAIPNYDTGSLSISENSGAWAPPVNVGLIFKGRIPLFTEIGARGVAREDTSSQSNPALIKTYRSAVIITDGSADAYRIMPTLERRVRRIGILAPSNSNITITVNPNVGLMAPGDYEFKIALADSTQSTDNNLLDSFGLLSNASVLLTSPQTILQNDEVVFELNDFTDNGVVATDTNDTGWKRFWTHIIVYGRNVTSLESGFVKMGSWYRDSAYKLPGDTGALIKNGAAWQAKLETSTRATGNGVYDYAPTRNHVPQNMSYFNLHRDRGFWAKRDEPFVWYSDIISPLTGGHVEAISLEFLPPFDGPISLLASYLDALIVGTPSSLFALSGQITSHTNQSVGADALLPESTHVVRQVASGDGPVRDGVGQSVVADGRLYFVSDGGLRAFDGQRIINVALGVQDLHVTPSVMANSTLAHDSEKHIIYLAERENSVTYSGDTAGTTGQVRTTIWCYHYRRINNLTGFGEWTRFKSIGAIAESNGNDQRYSCVGKNAAGKLLVGMRMYDDAASMRFDDCAVFRESGTSDGTAKAGSSGNINWSWKSGRWDAGLMDRAKQFYAVSANIARSAFKTAATFGLGFAVDDEAFKSVFYPETKQRIIVPVGRAGQEVAVLFSGNNTVDNEVLGYAIEGEPIGVG